MTVSEARDETREPEANGAEQSREAMRNLEAAGAAMIDGITKVQREIAEFVTERIRQDMETQQALLRCRTIEDVRGVQTEFIRTAMDMYVAEATKLVKLGGEVMAKSMDPRSE